MQSLGFIADCSAYTNYTDKISPYFSDKKKSLNCIHISRMDNHRSFCILYFIRNVSEGRKTQLFRGMSATVTTKTVENGITQLT